MSQLPKQPAEVSVPTSADVARLAGVSRATVSYVLNNNATVRISEPTRHRVREAAAHLGYVPHAAARSLRAGHSRLVLLPSGHIPAGPLHQRFFQELQAGLRRLDYTVVQYGSAASPTTRRSGPGPNCGPSPSSSLPASPSPRTARTSSPAPAPRR